MLDNGLDGSLLLQFLTAMFKVRADQVGWVYFKIWTLLQVKPVTLWVATGPSSFHTTLTSLQF
jgi:hypothetical protein